MKRRKSASQLDIELLILPYSSIEARSLLHVLLENLHADRWKRFRAAVAFCSQSGNSPDLLDALHDFLRRGGRVDLTFGADEFGAGNQGSEQEAIETLLRTFGREAFFRLFLFRDADRTFHPKLYVFSNAEETSALVIIGSSNWSSMAFERNVEANVIVRLDLTKKGDRRCYEKIDRCFRDYWQEQDQ